MITKGKENIHLILRHIRRVEENCIVLAEKLWDTDPEFALQLIQRGRAHDISKFNPYEFNHLDNKDHLFRSALTLHHSKNSHHPEFHSSIHDMDDIDLAEMVCDCMARAQEFGTDIKNWFFATMDPTCAPTKFGYSWGDSTWNSLMKYVNLLVSEDFSKMKVE